MIGRARNHEPALLPDHARKRSSATNARRIAHFCALMNPRFPRLFPPIWAVAWGDDRFGLWAELEIDGVAQRLRWIEPGEFLMGSPETEFMRFEDESPEHAVRITSGFWLADTTCTQALWMAVVGGTNPSLFSQDRKNPVERVSWDDAQGFLRRLGDRLIGAETALPTEAQWEYACRASTNTAFAFGNTVTSDQVNFGDFRHSEPENGAYRQRTLPVRTFAPNRWGLFEMHGNVWEWCADGDRKYESSRGVITDPIGLTELGPGAHRAVRGGSWVFDVDHARSANRFFRPRDFRLEDLGFRFALRS